MRTKKLSQNFSENRKYPNGQFKIKLFYNPGAEGVHVLSVLGDIETSVVVVDLARTKRIGP